MAKNRVVEQRMLRSAYRLAGKNMHHRWQGLAGGIRVRHDFLYLGFGLIARGSGGGLRCRARRLASGAIQPLGLEGGDDEQDCDGNGDRLGENELEALHNRRGVRVTGRMNDGTAAPADVSRLAS